MFSKGHAQSIVRFYPVTMVYILYSCKRYFFCWQPKISNLFYVLTQIVLSKTNTVIYLIKSLQYSSTKSIRCKSLTQVLMQATITVSLILY